MQIPDNFVILCCEVKLFLVSGHLNKNG